MTAAPIRVSVFFYGTIMNPVVMQEFGVIPTEAIPAKVYGFDIAVRPRPTLVRSDRSTVFGSIISVTHEDLTTIYSGLERNFGVIYRPEAVLAVTLDGAMRPVVCYIAENMAAAAPDPKFLQQLAQCVRTMGHPEWYAAHIEAQRVSHATHSEEPMGAEITRELLQTTPLADLPGWEVRLFLITYPPGADANNHSHPVVGVGFVLEGVMISAFDDDPEESFVAGQSFVDRASYHRIVRNGSEIKPMKFLIAYTVKTGEPNTVFPKT